MMSKAICLSSLLVIFGAVRPTAAQPAVATPADEASVTSPEAEPLDLATLDSLRALYKQLIDAEDRHDLATVRGDGLEVPLSPVRRQDGDTG